MISGPGVDSARASPRTMSPAVTGPIFDGLYEYFRRQTRLGREPA
ncbi:hypothetical protein ACPZ19_11805 [Amycolatopsis lurida]